MRLSTLLFITMIAASISFTFQNDPLERGLIAHYTFNECDARDDTGNGSDGRVYGDPGCFCGIDDDALILDGYNDYIEFEGRVNDYFTTSDFTISFYFKSLKNHIFKQSMLSKRSLCDENLMLDIQLDATMNEIDVDVYEAEFKYYPEISPRLDSTIWMHFALVREGTRAYTYINGQLRKEGFRCSGVDITNETLLSFANSPCLKGGRSTRFKGMLDELRIYDRALTTEEMAALYARYPIESAEIDCVTFAPKNSPKEYSIDAESSYLCGVF